jgi:hypothetical protein
VRDWSGAKNDLVLTNMDTAVAWNPGTQYRKISVDGSNDYLVSEQTLTGAKSVSGWWRTTSTTGYRRLFSINGNEWSAYLFNNNMDLRDIYHGIDSGSTGDVAAVSTWFHAAFTYNGTVSTFYVNGKLNTNTVTTTAATIDGFKIYFGQRSDLIQPFIGDMSGLMVHNRTLSQNEIQLLARDPSIAYERAPRRRAAEAATSTRRRRLLLLGAGT